MKHRLLAVALLALLGTIDAGCGGTRPAREGSRPGEPPSPGTLSRVDPAPFQAALEPYGAWVEGQSYGTVWVPHATPAGWRPYTNGRWLSTNHGWMWLGEEPWGWAAYHYGRWTFDPRLGWAWIPGDLWAPAWVVWRHGQGYVGWAPLVPDADWRRESSRDRSDGLARGVDVFAWSFVRARDFTARSVSSRIVPAGRNPTLVSLTRAEGRYVPSGARVAERGFSESGAVERPLRFRVVDAAAHRQNRAPIVHGSMVEVYRPEALRAQPSEEREPSKPRTSVGRVAQDAADRERREQERFEGRMERERLRLRSEHERERRQRPETLSEAKLRRRQETETQAQEAFERRERALFASRRDRWGGRAEP